MRPLLGWLLGVALIASPLAHAAPQGPQSAASRSVVPSAEVSPDVLGALVSAIAFVDACQSIRDASKEMVDAKPLEITFVQVVGEFCRGMVVAVASTMRAGQPYRVKGERVCVDPGLSPDKVIDHIKGQIDKDPQSFIGRPVPDVDTPAAIRRSIQALSPCG